MGREDGKDELGELERQNMLAFAWRVCADMEAYCERVKGGIVPVDYTDDMEALVSRMREALNQKDFDTLTTVSQEMWRFVGEHRIYRTPLGDGILDVADKFAEYGIDIKS
jgi:hypothetical protein